MTNNLQLNKTEDGSFTLYLPEYQENTHTVHGAYTEALYKHIIPSNICNKTGNLVVLDIGFGLGYNILALLKSINETNIDTLHIISFEKERAIADYLDMVKFGDDKDQTYDIIKNAFVNGSVSTGKISIDLCFGDARREIQKLNQPESVDAVFHDPHSPGKNSELWTVNFFKHLYDQMKPNGSLTTYSFAPQIRAGLLDAGFYVGSWTGSQFKKEGTLAAKSRFEGCFSDDQIESLLKDKRAVPYLDNGAMNLEREEIRLNRIEAVRVKKMQTESF